MKKNRLGCFTASGIMASIITAFIVAGFAFIKGGLLFNPGSLNAHTGAILGGASSFNARATAPLGGVSSHAEIAGQCNLCHAPFWSASTMADRCVVCHTDVATQWQDPSTLHGALRQNNPNLACRNCHPDHRGPDAPLIDLSNTHFPHNSYGFSLNGHRTKTDGSPFGCNDCHSQVYTGFDQAICTSCHLQVDSAFVQTHSLDFGNDCLACHDGLDSFGHTFDHTGVAFELTGKHGEVFCTQCHINARVMADLISTPQDCNSCHAVKDPHKSRYGTDCGTCHTTKGWSPASFDHNLSTFKLDGKHINVPCEACHVDHVFVGTPTDCYSCHEEKDPHKGSLGTDCATCHTTTGWKPSTYDHNLSTFKLAGKHTTIVCLSCHINNVFKGTPTDCYSCHKKDDNHNGSLGSACGSCHTVSGWKPSTYDHNLSVFKLTGLHTTTDCTKCHIKEVFNGIPADCNSCHHKDDRHNGQYGTNCSTCHTAAAWKPATFDHNLSAFKLTGKHTTTACLSCHGNNVFKGTPSDCNSCHRSADPHSGRYGTNCGTCHPTTAWKPATFDHNLSAFKLTGSHTSVGCTNCHTNGIYKGTPTDCNSCHKNSDPHAGRFGINCGSCHTTAAWKPASFDHNLSTFKLTGSHASVACASCHTNGVFKGTPTDCNSCHKNSDPHAGRFGINCGSCHTTAAWKPASFDHNLAAFKLTGSHTSVACASCHTNGIYKGTPTDCNSCHKNIDPHAGRFGINCGSCHTTAAWKPASFDHNLAAFKLTGSHTSVACASCHTNGVYKGTPSDCYSCHKNDDNHGGSYGSSCGSCHATTAWKPASFDHNLSSFKLTGAHANLSCSQCHSGGVYKGLSSACSSCHADPAFHAGLFGTNCSSCHTTSAWRPATYNGPHTFPTGHGSAASCQTCHPSGYTSYTCYGCHEHTVTNIKDKHKNIPNFENCTSCHPTGKKD